MESVRSALHELHRVLDRARAQDGCHNRVGVTFRAVLALVPDPDAGQLAAAQKSEIGGTENVSGCSDRLLPRSEEHTSELQSLMRTSYAVCCLKKKKPNT